MKERNIEIRILQICDEFDARVEAVGVLIARLELAKALAEAEDKLKKGTYNT